MGAPAPIFGGVYQAEADGLAFAMRAAPFGRQGAWGVDVSVDVTPAQGAHAIAEQALTLVPTLYYPDGSSRQMASRGAVEGGAPCVRKGVTTTRLARQGRPTWRLRAKCCA